MKYCHNLYYIKRLQELVVTFIIIGIIMMAIICESAIILFRTMITVSFFSTWNQKWNAETVSVNRPLLEFLILSIRIGCCNFKRVQLIKLHVLYKPRNTAEKIDWPSIRSFDFSSAWIRIPLYDRPDNHRKVFARVKAKREGACATSFTVFTRVIVHAKRRSENVDFVEHTLPWQIIAVL